MDFVIDTHVTHITTDTSNCVISNNSTEKQICLNFWQNFVEFHRISEIFVNILSECS